jgi:hypothetical protein
MITLTKRKFIRTINYHYFINDNDKSLLKIECSDAQYQDLGGKNLVPHKEGYTWKQSSQGETFTDSPTGELGENEYTLLSDTEAQIVYKRKDGMMVSTIVDPALIVNDEIDPINLPNY